VNLTWNATNIHNEDFFAIQRDGVIIATRPKHSQSWSGSSQPAGQHTYTVVSHTSAHCLGFGGYCGSASVQLTVQGPPPPARPINLRWDRTTTTVPAEWTDNSTNETQFQIWKCGDWGPTATKNTTTSGSTGQTYTQVLTIPNDSKGCFVVNAVNSGGASAFTPGIAFLNTTKGNCITESPCLSHSTKRIEMLLSKRTESGNTIDYIAYSRDSSTLYKVDFFDNVYGGIHLDGWWNVTSGNNTAWQNNLTTSTNTVVVFWCRTSTCADKHWEALGY
jgi:hypothetical protein